MKNIEQSLFPDARKTPEQIIKEALDLNPVAIFAGLSGGDDSIVVAHWMMTNVAGCRILHINTGIGIEATRIHVRETCERYGWPLTEVFAKEDCGMDYDEIVLKHGFPGPSQHQKMYIQLKERCIEKLVRDNKKRYSRQKILIATGIRHDESKARTGYAGQEVHIRKAQIWASPLYWHDKAWFMDYIREHDLPRGPISQLLGMSGECLCGAYADEGELALVSVACPKTGARIKALQDRVRAAGHDWGWEEMPPRKSAQKDAFNPLCVGCGKHEFEADMFA